MLTNKDIYAITLVVISIGILAFNYGYITIDSFNITLGPLSLSGLKITNIVLVLDLVIFIVVVLCIKYHWHEISNNYSLGYRNSAVIIELARKAVADATESDMYNNSHNSICVSLWKCKSNLGIFRKFGGDFCEQIIVEPSTRDHLRGILSGFKKSITPSLFLRVYTPLFFAFLSLLSMHL